MKKLTIGMVAFIAFLIAISFIFLVSIPNSVFFDVYSASKAENYEYLTVDSSKLILVVYPNIYDPFEASSRPRYNTYIASIIFYDGSNLFVIKLTPKDLDTVDSRNEPGERYSVISASLAEYTAKVWSRGAELEIYFVPSNSIPDNPFMDPSMYIDKFNRINMLTWYALEPHGWSGFKELDSPEKFLQQFRNFVESNPLNKRIEIYTYNYNIAKIFEGGLGEGIVKSTNNGAYIRLTDESKGLRDFYLDLKIKNDSRTELNLQLKLDYSAKRPILLQSSITFHNRTVYLEEFIDFSALSSLSLHAYYPFPYSSYLSMDVLAYSFSSRGIFDVLLTFTLPLIIVGIEYINKILRLKTKGSSQFAENLLRDTVYMTIIVVFILISAYMPYLEQYRYGDNIALYIIGSYVISSTVYILYLVAKQVSSKAASALLSILAIVFIISLMLWTYVAYKVTSEAFEKISVNYVYVPPPTVFDERTFAIEIPVPWSSIPWSISFPTVPVPTWLVIPIIVLTPISLNIYLIPVAVGVMRRIFGFWLSIFHLHTRRKTTKRDIDYHCYI